MIDQADILIGVFILVLAFLLLFIGSSSDGQPHWLDIKELRKIAGENRDLNRRVDDFIDAGRSRGNLEEFMSSLRIAAQEAEIKLLHAKAGIVNPSGSDRLMAIQILAIQEQNAILKNAKQ